MLTGGVDQGFDPLPTGASQTHENDFETSTDRVGHGGLACRASPSRPGGDGGQGAVACFDASVQSVRRVRGHAERAAEQTGHGREESLLRAAADEQAPGRGEQIHRPVPAGQSRRQSRNPAPVPAGLEAGPQGGGRRTGGPAGRVRRQARRCSRRLPARRRGPRGQVRRPLRRRCAGRSTSSGKRRRRRRPCRGKCGSRSRSTP